MQTFPLVNGAEGEERLSLCGRLSVGKLMVVTGGVAVAFSLQRVVLEARSLADVPYYGWQPVNFNLSSGLVALVYGLTFTLFVLAWSSKPFWSIPGKTLAMLFAAMGILDWSLDWLASTIVINRFALGPKPSADWQRGWIWGIWYQQFSAALGYLLAIPLLLWVMVRSRQQHLTWRLAWCGFLVFSLAILARVYLPTQYPPWIERWYFKVAIGLPIILLAVAWTRGFCRRELDWWTSLTCIPLILAWITAVGTKWMT